MTYSEIVEAIQCLDEKLDGWYRVRRNIKDELDVLDKVIQAKLKKKWALESALITVKKCPSYNGPRAYTAKPRVGETIELKDLSEKEILRVLAELKRREEAVE
jgi:hypothetical protein